MPPSLICASADEGERNWVCFSVRELVEREICFVIWYAKSVKQEKVKWLRNWLENVAFVRRQPNRVALDACRYFIVPLIINVRTGKCTNHNVVQWKCVIIVKLVASMWRREILNQAKLCCVKHHSLSGHRNRRHRFVLDAYRFAFENLYFFIMKNPT